MGQIILQGYGRHIRAYINESYDTMPPCSVTMAALKLIGIFCLVSVLKGIPTSQAYSLLSCNIQSNFNGSNTFGTMKICSRQG